MVRLRNIKRNNEIMSCEFIPEGSSECGTLVINTESKKIESCLFPSGYEWCKSHVSHAADYLIEIASDEMIPEQRTLMWY